MGEFFEAVLDPGIPFARYALIAGVLASLSFGIVGTYVVTRRITYIAGAISHSVLGGIGAALYASHELGWTWCKPIHGAVLSALLSAVVIGLVSLYGRQREDTIIGSIWAIGMAVGLLFIGATAGYVDPMSYLFGNILLIGRHDLWLIAGLDIFVIGLSVLFYNKLQAVCFDEEFARLRGLRVERYYLLLLCLTALTVVLLVTVVGIVMVVALLTLPAAVAGLFARRMWQMMVLSVAFSLLFTVAGVGCSFVYDLSTGPTIIVIAGVVYLVVSVSGRFWHGRRLWRARHRQLSRM